MGGLFVDTSRWPIVVHSVEGSVTDEQLDAWVEEATAILLKGEPHVTILDASRIGSVSAYSRSRAIAWQRRYAQELRAHCLGTAYVLKSPLLRFIAMTVLMVTRLPTPLRVCESRAEAVVWAEGLLSAAGLPVPPAR